MEFVGRLLGLGAAILGAVIFFILILAAKNAGLLGDLVGLVIGIFKFLIIDLGGLLIRLGDALING
jgi:hypothetical protein